MTTHLSNKRLETDLRTRLLRSRVPEFLDIRSHKRLELEVIHARELCTVALTDTNSATLGHWVASHDSKRGAYAGARQP